MPDSDYPAGPTTAAAQPATDTAPAAEPPAPPPRPERRYVLPLLLFVATCASTVYAQDVVYGVAIMTILLAHEMGHFVQAVRHRVPASLPYFIPVPFPFFPFGTMGAIIAMQGHRADRRALFDIGISGPLAGLVFAIPAVIVGLFLSRLTPIPVGPPAVELGEPLLFRGISALIWGTVPAGWQLDLHPLAFAGWVGLFVTGLNLIPVGQLDGGHVAYALLGRRAHRLAILLMVALVAFMITFQYWGWSVWLVLMLLIGPKHPPTANDHAPLGWKRRLLGWATLAFIIVCFTPMPFQWSR